jgi:hypothetical protein
VRVAYGAEQSLIPLLIILLAPARRACVDGALASRALPANICAKCQAASVCGLVH